MRVTATILAVLCSSPLALGEMVTASNLTNPISFSSYFEAVGYEGVAGFTNGAVAQRFVADVGGTLSSIDATVDRFQHGGWPLRVSIHAPTPAGPGASLGEVQFPAESLPNVFAANRLDLSAAGIDLVGGESYFVVLRTDQPIHFSTRYRALLINPSAVSFAIPAMVSRDGGAAWETGVRTNLELGLTVRVVPEPGTVWLLLVSTAVWGPRGPRRAIPSACRFIAMPQPGRAGSARRRSFLVNIGGHSPPYSGTWWAVPAIVSSGRGLGRADDFSLLPLVSSRLVSGP